MPIRNRFTVLAGLLLSLTVGAAAFAANDTDLPTRGITKDWQLGFQPMVTDVGQDVAWFHDDILMPFVGLPIAVLVAGLMLYVIIRFRAKANPEPRRFSHNTLIEVVWTLAPAIIVFVIAIIAVRQVYFQDAPPEDWAEYTDQLPEEGEVVLKATGNQFNWTYEYPEEDGLTFDANLVPDEDLKPGEPRLLTTDENVVIPVNTVIRLQVTADPAGVLHAWTIPAFGVKLDAVPGRLNERWFRVLPGFEGRYYGQCSELCGRGHAFMPITVDVVSPEDYRAWLQNKKIEFGLIEPEEEGDDVAALTEQEAETAE